MVADPQVWQIWQYNKNVDEISACSHCWDYCEMQDAGGVENSPEIWLDEIILIPFQFIGKIVEMFSVCKLQS